MAIYRLGNVHMKKFDDIEKVILRIELSFTMKRPKPLLANTQKHLQRNVSNISLNVARINTFVPKGLVEVTVLSELFKDPNKQANHIC